MRVASRRRLHHIISHQTTCARHVIYVQTTIARQVNPEALNMKKRDVGPETKMLDSHVTQLLIASHSVVTIITQ